MRLLMGARGILLMVMICNGDIYLLTNYGNDKRMYLLLGINLCVPFQNLAIEIFQKITSLPILGYFYHTIA